MLNLKGIAGNFCLRVENEWCIIVIGVQPIYLTFQVLQLTTIIARFLCNI